ncbi:hypothetical protein [Microcoleus sp. herbarium14]
MLKFKGVCRSTGCKRDAIAQKIGGTIGPALGIGELLGKYLDLALKP